MSKLKRANCIKCGKPIGRHDSLRQSIAIPVLTRPHFKIVWRHLKCGQGVTT